MNLFLAEIECEPPNNNLLRFEGKLTWNEQIYSLKNDNILLRGTRLRNTQWAIGGKLSDPHLLSLSCSILVVCNAGQDTKLMQNSGKPQFKRTKIDYWLNKIIFGVISFFLMN
jgi:magnesium-transporting ATPase (P-type)